MCNAFFVDIPAADFKLADKFLADALPCESDMRMRLIGDCHDFAVAELETQRKMTFSRIVQTVIRLSVVLPKIQPIERVR
jgi:hypothetical protein